MAPGADVLDRPTFEAVSYLPKHVLHPAVREEVLRRSRPLGLSSIFSQRVDAGGKLPADVPDYRIGVELNPLFELATRSGTELRVRRLYPYTNWTSRAGDPSFARWMLSHHERTYDPRMERYWKLIATLKRWECDPTIAEAYRWLIEGLRRRVAESQRAEGERSMRCE